MESGEILFVSANQPPKTLQISNGAFSGEVHTGKNRVEVILMKEGPPNPMDPSKHIQVNSISNSFWGPESTLSADVDPKGGSEFKFDVNSARR
jgi:hypothetical protein